MHWVVQQNLINPLTLAELLQHLSKRNIEYTLVTLAPLINVLSPDVDVQAPNIFTYGSTGLGPVSREKGWAPGYYDDNLDYRHYLQHYGTDLLNHDAIIAPLGQLEKQWDQFFLRPISDGKSFAGEVMDWEYLTDWREKVKEVENDVGVTLTVSDLVAMAPCKEIYAEYRFFVIDGKIVTGSRYKVGDRVQSSSRDVSDEVVQYARAQVSRWQPNCAFAIDIAQTSEGLKVIELNSANSAGFYACDIGAIVEAVERM
jgi:hypothetical protein